MADFLTVQELKSVFFFFGWGKGGKCFMHCNANSLVPCVGLQCSVPVGQFTHWTTCCLIYPLKTPFAGGIWLHPFLCEIDGWICLRAEISEMSIHPEGFDSVLPSQPSFAFHKVCYIPAFLY